MNTKICTSIEQSKKLIELGIDTNTADMFWDTAEPDKRRKPMVGPISDYYDMEDWAIPAWSLAALLDILPNNEHIGTTTSKGSWKIDTIEYLPNTWWCEYQDSKNQTEFNISADNPVDACVNMIIKLNELKTFVI